MVGSWKVPCNNISSAAAVSPETWIPWIDIDEINLTKRQMMK